MERRSKIALFVVLAVAFAIRLGTALAFPNIYHPDEVYQYLEQAHRLAFGSGVVPWEFREGIRSWIIPGFLAGVMRVTAWFTPSAATYMAVVMAVLSLLSLSIVSAGFLWARQAYGLEAAVFTGGLCAVWFELVYFAPKALSEVIATHAFLCALYAIWPGEVVESRKRLFWGGVLLGVAVALRIHLAPAAAVAAVYICRRELRSRWAPLMFGGGVMLAATGLLDALTWGRAFQSTWGYFWENLVQGKSAHFGVQPWSFYGEQFLQNWSGVLVPIIALSVLGARRFPLLGWVALTILISHNVVPHKEYRFLYPVVALAMILVGLGTAELMARVHAQTGRRVARWAACSAAIVLWAVVSLSLAVVEPYRTYWHRFSGPIRAARFINQQADACGVGLVDMEWFDTAGYVHLHRNVPMYLSRLGPDLEKVAPGFNYALSNGPVIPYTDFRRVQCWEDAPWFKPVCVHRRAGMCRRVPEYEINAVLKRVGE